MLFLEKPIPVKKRRIDFREKARNNPSFKVLICAVFGLILLTSSFALWIACEIGKKMYVNSFSINIIDTINEAEEKLITVVNYKNPVEANYRVDLENVRGIQCDKIIKSKLEEMLKAAEKQGYSLKLEKGYVSEQDQTELYCSECERILSQNKGYSKVKADIETNKKLGKPKYDEHHTGLSIDITAEGVDANSFATTSEYEWLIKNCIQYGFVLRFPKNKEHITKINYNPNTFRYVGITNAIHMRTTGVCLEEYYRDVSNRKLVA